MDHLDTLLAESSPPRATSAALSAITAKVTSRRPRRAVLIAGLVALSLGGATAAAAGTGTLDELVDYYLGHGDPAMHNDHAWEMDITGTDGTFHCVGGIVVMPMTSKAEYDESHYLAIKNFIRDHDWSDLKPDRSLLRADQTGTADQLAITADRHMIEVAQDAGYSVDSITTSGTAQCEPK